MLLTGHKGRAYNIIHEQELLDAEDQLVASLARQPQATPPLRVVQRGDGAGRRGRTYARARRFIIGHAQGGQVTGQQRPIPPG